MAFTRIDIGNMALALVGSSRIAAFDDGSAEGEQLATHYDAVVESALTAPGGSPFRWSFATRQDALTRLADAPDARWAYAYQKPPDMLHLHAVTRGDHPVPFDAHGDRILTDADGDLFADYTARADEGTWPPHFRDGVVHELAARLALGLNENAALAKTIRGAYDWRGARTADSQARSSRRLIATRLTGARYGGSRGRWWR